LLKANAAAGPFLIFREDVLGDEDYAGGATDELVVLGVGLRSYERENSGAVGRRYGDESFAGLEFGVVGEVEAELVDVEAEAAVLVADVDGDGVDAEVGRGIRGWCGGGHGRDYTVRRGDEKGREKDNADSRIAQTVTSWIFRDY